MNSDSGASVRSFLSSAAILTTSQYVAAAVGFATTLLAARWLGPKNFGLAAVIMAYPAAASSFASVKTSTVTQRYVSGFRATHHHPELLAACKLGFLVDFTVSLLAAVAIAAAVLLAGDPPGTQGNGDLVGVFALSLPVGSFVGTSIVVLFAFERFRLVGALQVMQKVLVLIAVLTGLLIRRDTAGLVVGTAAGQAATGLIYLVVASALLGRAVGDHWWTASWSSLQDHRKELRSLLTWNFLAVTLSGVMNQVPVLLLGAIRSPVDAGYFRLASTIAATADAVEAAMSRIAYAALAAADAQRNVPRMAQLVVSWSKRESLIGLAVVLAVMALLPALVLVALGQRYMKIVPGAEMLLVGTATSTAFFFLTPYLFSRGEIRKWVAAYGLYALSALGLGWLVAEHGGFFALAAVVGVGLAVLNSALGLPILRWARRMAAARGAI